MHIPVVRGVIERRILVNYRVEPSVLQAALPSPFRPKLHRGWGLAGICLIRLRGIRPAGLPAWAGISSENAAHRIAVEWDENGERREGVYVRRRDTDSRWNVLAGGRIFPGVHSHATFDVHETDEHFDVALRSDDGSLRVSVSADRAGELPSGSIFASLAEASAFFEGGSTGYSDSPRAGRYHGLELRCLLWEVEPLAVSRVESSVFDDRRAFPQDSIAFDCALLMRGIEHEWHGRADLNGRRESDPRAPVTLGRSTGTLP